MYRKPRLVLATAILCFMSRPALSADPSIHFELNSVAAAGESCRVSFVVENKLGSLIEDLKIELVLFNKDGQINRLLSVNFGRMPLNKTRVRQFDLKGVPCSNISRLLLNNVTQCKGEKITLAFCTDAVKTTSRSSVAFSY